MKEANSVIPFDYNGNQIRFKKDGDVFVNATEMAKPFGKLPAEWRRLPSTKEYIKKYLAMGLSHSHNISELIKVTYGTNSCTWFHEDIALEFARWLSPEFSIWCNERIKELIKHGVTATPQTIEKMINNPDFTIKLLTELKEERKAKEIAIEKNKKLQPKADHMDRVLESGKMINIGQAAKILELPFGRNTLYKKLREMGVFFKYKNEPKQEHVAAGRFVLKEKEVERKGHSNLVVTKVLVTQKGLAYLGSLFPERNTKLPWN